MHACTHGKGTAGLVDIRRGIKNSLEVAQPQTRGKGKQGAQAVSSVLELSQGTEGQCCQISWDPLQLFSMITLN